MRQGTALILGVTGSVAAYKSADLLRRLKDRGAAVEVIMTEAAQRGPLPDAIKKSLSAWAGCVAGAVEAEEYVGMMGSVGFTDISIVPVYFDQQTVDSALSDMKDVIELNTISYDDVSKAVYSAKITAYKP